MNNIIYAYDFRESENNKGMELLNKQLDNSKGKEIPILYTFPSPAIYRLLESCQKVDSEILKDNRLKEFYNIWSKKCDKEIHIHQKIEDNITFLDSLKGESLLDILCNSVNNSEKISKGLVQISSLCSKIVDKNYANFFVDSTNIPSDGFSLDIERGCNYYKTDSILKVLNKRGNNRINYEPEAVLSGMVIEAGKFCMLRISSFDFALLIPFNIELPDNTDLESEYAKYINNNFV